MTARRVKKKKSSIKDIPIEDNHTPKKKRRRLLVWIASFLVITLIGVLLYFALRNNDQQIIVSELVTLDDLVQTVEVTGGVESKNEAELSFNSSGIVEQVFVSVGDVVSEGDIIAYLDRTELQADVNQSNQAVQVAQANLSLQQAGATSEEVLVALAAVDSAQASLSSAQIQLANSKTSGDAQIESAALALSSAEDSLANIISLNSQSLIDVKANLISSMKSSVVDIRTALSGADDVLGIDNSLVNDSFESILGHENPSIVDQAEQAYDVAKADRDVAEGIVFSLTSSDSLSTIENAAEDVEQAYSSVQDTLLKTRQALDATSLETISFSLDDLSQLKASIDSERNLIQSSESTFVMGRNTLASTQITIETSEIDAVNAISQAEQSYNQAVIQKDSDVASAEAAIALQESEVDRAEASLQQVQADPRFVDLASFIADVDRARAQLDAARARLDGATIIAPISGSITDVAIEVGEQISIGSVAVMVQTTGESFKITADIPEADIFKVTEEDMALITFDAFGSDVVFDGKVIEIDPAENTVEGVIFYKAEITLEETPKGLRPGMSTDITITTERIRNVITVPQRAILEVDGQKIVRVLTDGRNYEERAVVIGIRGDGGRTQILEGLNEGDEIVVSIRD